MLTDKSQTNSTGELGITALLMTRRNALTLLELVVSMASSIVLVAGLAGSLYISNQALSGSTNARQSLTASTVLRDLMADASEAQSITERTDHAITFKVPDRNGDSIPDVIRYAWSGTPGDPLTYQYNGGPIAKIATDVRAFALTEPLIRVIAPEINTTPVATNIVFEGKTEMYSNSTSGLGIPKPPNTSTGDLLVACVVTDGNSTFGAAPSGWTLRQAGWGRSVPLIGTKNVTFGVWTAIAGAETGPYNFSWSTGNKPAYGWIMRFTGHDPMSPINASAIAESSSNSQVPPCPPVTTTVDNAMILRLGGFDGNRLNSGSPGLSLPTQHTAIASVSSLSACCVGGGWVLQPTAGNCDTSLFSLSSGEEYVTVTIAIAPKLPE
jgi:hypothetical protein